MKKSIVNSIFFAVFVLCSSNAFAWNWAGSQVFTTGAREVGMQFYKKFKPESIAYSNADKVVWMMFHPKPHDDIEFYVDRPNYMGAFSITDIYWQESTGGGFIFEMTEGNYDQKAFYWAPYPKVKKGSGNDARMNFNAYYSYRATVYRTLNNGKVSACYPIGFEIEGAGPWVVEPGFDSNGHAMASLDDKKVAHIPGLEKCTQEMCGELFDLQDKEPCIE